MRALRRAGWALGVLAFVGLFASLLLAGPTGRAGALPSQVTVGTSPATTATQTPTAPPGSIAPLGNRLPVSPVTLPLRTHSSNAHVSPVFAYLSVAGFAVAILIALGRMFLTRAGGPDRQPVPLEADGLD